MNESEKDFRERLLEREQFSPNLKQKYEKEVQEMLEQKLTGIKRWGYIFSAILSAGLGVTFGTLAVVLPREFPILGRIGFIAGGIFGLAFAGLSGWIARKGTLKLKSHPKTMAGMAWGFVVTIVTLSLLWGARYPDSVRSVIMLLWGVVFLVIAAVFKIFNRVDQAQLKTREKLLEIEYRLAQIAEEIAKKEQK